MDFTLWIQDSRYSRLSIIRTFKGNKKSSSYQEQNYIEKDLKGFELSVLSVERGLEIPTVSGLRIADSLS